MRERDHGGSNIPPNESAVCRNHVPNWLLLIAPIAVLWLFDRIFGGVVSALAADAINPWLAHVVPMPVWSLLALLLAAFMVGLIAYRPLESRFGSSGSPSDSPFDEPARSPARSSSLRDKAVADLDAVLADMAHGGTQRASTYVSKLRHVFDRLERDEDSEWCSAEFNGYGNHPVPDYRKADVDFIWRIPGGLAGHMARPESRTELVPFPDSVSDLVRDMQTGREWRTGKVFDSQRYEYREFAKAKPSAIRGVVRSIFDEAYRRARAARTEIGD